VWDVFQIALPGLMRSDGSFDYAAIKNTFDLLEIDDKSIRGFLFSRFFILIIAIQKARQKK
jgi:hypothetical protein